ncbi:MAG: MFS transporter [Gemmatimonadota bacterium]
MTESTGTPPGPASAATPWKPGQTRRIAAWASYDWASSAFTTVVVTFLYAEYFRSAIVPDVPGGIPGSSIWGWAVSASAVFVALLSPVFGAMADRGGRRRFYLIVSTVICVVFTVALGLVAPSTPNAVLLAVLFFVVANSAFDIGGVFYNSFLPAVAPPEKLGTISGIGWGIGYMAGLVSMCIALFGFIGFPETVDRWFSISTDSGLNYRAPLFLVAAWFAVFSIPMFLFVKDEGPTRKGVGVGEAFAELRSTFREVRRFRETAKFLLARLVFNDGLVTIFSMSSIYLGAVFGMGLGEIMMVGIAINLLAGLSAFGFGFVDDKIGAKRTVLISVVALGVAVTIAAIAPSKSWFWVSAVLVGLFSGPNQAASRSLMSRFVPDHQQAEFFGFFSFSGKATAFLGPFLFAWLTNLFQSESYHSERIGISVLILMFAVGGLILWTVDETEGIRAAREASAKAA